MNVCISTRYMIIYLCLSTRRTLYSPTAFQWIYVHVGDSHHEANHCLNRLLAYVNFCNLCKTVYVLEAFLQKGDSCILIGDTFRTTALLGGGQHVSIHKSSHRSKHVVSTIVYVNVIERRLLLFF